MKSTATAVWNGGLKDGKGNLTAGTGSFNGMAYDFGKRFEGAGTPGTTPEELIAAAHAGCYAMALSGGLNKAGVASPEINAVATVVSMTVHLGLFMFLQLQGVRNYVKDLLGAR